MIFQCKFTKIANFFACVKKLLFKLIVLNISLNDLVLLTKLVRV